ncbi:hypothetical protein KCP91_15450 [Microvirga sp. SRT01]|uniref:Integrase n=1 Tax=Sphingomonas longa TaxID=2778730 RepID=A0ABS2DA09_9SPHN|nr:MULTISPECIES: hypothetical protein [Alphaproteobacteria]MBM6577778.1 hypothetical protein [Sphingomonas sp. BT552]MBR7710820.1 hypothetical protein [Microvirga sp. SRT01]
MPIIRSSHLARARFERKMADLSATNMARIIHTKLADLHWAAGHTPTSGPSVDGGTT